jgi:hypothetical protein
VASYLPRRPRVLAQVSRSEIFGGQWYWERFLPSPSIFCCQYHSTAAPYSLMCQLEMGCGGRSSTQFEPKHQQKEVHKTVQWSSVIYMDTLSCTWVGGRSSTQFEPKHQQKEVHKTVQLSSVNYMDTMSCTWVISLSMHASRYIYTFLATTLCYLSVYIHI